MSYADDVDRLTAEVAALRAELEEVRERDRNGEHDRRHWLERFEQAEKERDAAMARAEKAEENANGWADSAGRCGVAANTAQADNASLRAALTEAQGMAKAIGELHRQETDPNDDGDRLGVANQLLSAKERFEAALSAAPAATGTEHRMTAILAKAIGKLAAISSNLGHGMVHPNDDAMRLRCFAGDAAKEIGADLATYHPSPAPHADDRESFIRLIERAGQNRGHGLVVGQAGDIADAIITFRSPAPHAEAVTEAAWAFVNSLHKHNVVLSAEQFDAYERLRAVLGAAGRAT